MDKIELKKYPDGELIQTCGNCSHASINRSDGKNCPFSPRVQKIPGRKGWVQVLNPCTQNTTIYKENAIKEIKE